VSAIFDNKAQAVEKGFSERVHAKRGNGTILYSTEGEIESRFIGKRGKEK